MADGRVLNEFLKVFFKGSRELYDVFASLEKSVMLLHVAQNRTPLLHIS